MAILDSTYDSKSQTKLQKRSALRRVYGGLLDSNKYSSQDLHKTNTLYSEMIGLGKKAQFSATAFDELVTERVQNFLGLQKAQTPDEKLIYKELNKNENNTTEQTTAKQAVQKELNNALQLSDEFVQAQKEYSQSITHFITQIQEQGKSHSIDNLIPVFENHVNEAKQAIKKQQSKEIAYLSKKFTEDADFKKNIKESLNLTDTQIEEVQNSLIKNLEETHKNQNELFEKSTSDSFTKLHQIAEEQRKDFLFVAMLHKNDPGMRKIIEKIAEENRKKFGSNDLEISMGPTDNLVDISSVRLEQLKFIELVHGKKISQNEGPPVSFRFDMGKRLFNPLYYVNNRASTDMLVMAQAVRASGSQSVTMTLNFKNEKIANQRARESYDACIKAGFPPEKIKINVNGRLYTHNASETKGSKSSSVQELFHEHQNHFGHLQQESKRIREDLKKQELILPAKMEDKASDNHFKKEYQDIILSYPDKWKTAPLIKEPENNQTTPG